MKKNETIHLPKQVHRNLVLQASILRYVPKTIVEKKVKEGNFRKEKYRKNLSKENYEI